MKHTMYPTQVYAGLKSNPGIITAEHLKGEVTAKDRQITVVGVGEVAAPPDRFSLTIRITSKKDNVSDAKNSISKRLDYVKQTLNNHNVQVIFKKIDKREKNNKIIQSK